MTQLETLREDCRKRMEALGYEDTSILDAKDIDSLKQLKKDLLEEKKRKAEEKKEKTKDIKAFRNLLVKVSRVFKDDSYWYNGRVVLPGENSKRDLPGEFLLKILEEEITSVETLFLLPNPTLKEKILYIKDASALKALLDEIPDDFWKVREEGIERGIIEILEEGDRSFDDIKEEVLCELSQITEESDEMVEVPIPEEEEVLSMKKVFPIQYKDFPPVDVNCSLFPYFSDKETSAITFLTGVKYEKEGSMTIYYARFCIYYGYFRIYMKIFYF